MIMLIFASIWSWALIFQKRGTLSRLNRRATRFEDSFWSGEPLRFTDDVTDLKRFARCSDATNFAEADRKTLKRPVQSGEIAGWFDYGCSRTGYQM